MTDLTYYGGFCNKPDRGNENAFFAVIPGIKDIWMYVQSFIDGRPAKEWTMEQIVIAGHVDLIEQRIRDNNLVYNYGKYIDTAGTFRMGQWLLNHCTKFVYNCRRPIPEFINKLCQLLKTNTTVQKLDLSKNFIDEEQALVLGDMIKHNTSLQVLILYNNHLFNDGTTSILEGVKNNTNLHALDLGSNCINVRSLMKELPFTNLTTLSLSNNSIDCTELEILLSSIEDTSVVSLNLGQNEIGNRGADKLGQFLSSNCTLRYINLERNNITDIKELARGLAHNNTLEVLHLRNTRSNLVNKIRRYSDGRMIDINFYNRIGNDGAIELGKMLKINTALQKLTLCYNNIGSVGVQGLIEGLDHNKTLQVLDLRDNGLLLDAINTLKAKPLKVLCSSFF